MVNSTLLLELNTSSLHKAKSKLNISHYLFLLFWLLKPFYFRESGSMQISDVIFVLSFISWIVINRGIIVTERHNLFYLLFTAFTFIINLIYTFIWNDNSYLMSTFYYLYNFLVIIIFSDFKDNKSFLKLFLMISIINLFIQLSILTLGIGSYLWGDFRFMGSFNDPNQFAFSMFTSFLIVYILSQYFYNHEEKSKLVITWASFFLAFYFVFQGSSTGMLLGFMVFIVMLAIVFTNQKKTPSFVFIKFLGILIIVATLILITVNESSLNNLKPSAESSATLFSRLAQKINILSEGGLSALLKDRGVDKVASYPYYLIYGAGEGSFISRFPESVYEVHSTFPGILFYYGIIPLAILFIWIWNNIKEMHFVLLPAYLALIIESFTLANQRQPAFWIIIVLSSLSYVNRLDQQRYILKRNIGKCKYQSLWEHITALKLWKKR